MCQKTSPEIPLKMIVHSMYGLISSVKENAAQCMTFLPESNPELGQSFQGAIQTAEQLQLQIDRIMEELMRMEKESLSHKTKITYFD